MKNLIYLFSIISFLTFSCNNTSTETEKPKTKAEVSEDEKWNSFWKDFHSSISKNDMGKLIELTALPLQGNFFTSTENGLTRLGIIKNYNEIFGNGVRERIIAAKTDEWQQAVIKDANQAKKLGVPQGGLAKMLQLNYVFNEGKDNQTESSQIFYFAKIDGSYKWCSMFIAG